MSNASGFCGDRLARIPRFLEAQVAMGALPGALTLIWRDGKIAYHSMVGAIDLARGTAMREDAIFRLYSMTKPVTAMALLMLLEEGRIGLDDAVSKFIPGIAALKLADGSNPRRAITVLDLLRHTAGFTYGFHNRTMIDAAYRAQKIAEFDTEGGLPAMIAQLEKLPLEYSPGDAWIYSVATDVAGYLVQLVSGQTYADFVRQKILAPLKMTDTDFLVPPDKRDRFAACYALRDGKLDLFDDPATSKFRSPPKLESGGGGLVGTAADYLRFARLLLNKGELDGVRLLAPKTVALMTANHLPGGKEIAELSPSTDAFNESGYRGIGFGLGVAVTLDPARVGIPGTTGEFTWGGMASTTFFVDPKEDMAVIFMTQVIADTARRVRLRRDLRTLIYSAMTQAMPASIVETLPLTDWNGPYEPAVKARAVAALEAGSVLFFPGLAFVLAENEKQFLDARVSDGKAKNISLDPGTGKIQSTALTGDAARQLTAMMARFSDQSSSLVRDLLPYRNVERARTSYRPVEVKGRSYSKISDDRLLHVDAFPSRPMRGRRILRFFANVAPASPRHWLVGEPFEQFARSFLPRVRPHPPGKSWLYEKLGVTRGRRSLYDELMLSLHDTGKLDDDFQKTSPRDAVDFPAGSCWLVFTDQVLHAALGGEFALEQTFHLDVAQMAEPARAPIRVLERLSGRPLT